jgi:hypothetical protein
MSLSAPWPLRFAQGKAAAIRTPLFWGFAEASFFVLIPDIAITFVALFAGLRPGLRAVGWALVGAVAGGLVVFVAPHAWQAFFAYLPGISAAIMADAAARLAADGWWAVVVGPAAGIPYKLYAAEAAIQGFPWWELVAVTPFARGWRFLLACLGAYAIGVLLRWRRIGAPILRWPWAIVACHAIFWILVYVRYFMFVESKYGA